VEEALDDLLETGLIIVEIDIDLWITVEGTDEVIPPPDIVDNICVNECSGNGLCIESKIYIVVLLAPLNKRPHLKVVPLLIRSISSNGHFKQ
jgi:hypothetical protein